LLADGGHPLPLLSGLFKITIVDLGREVDSLSNPLLVRWAWYRLVGQWLQAGWVVWHGSVVVLVDAGILTVALEGRVGSERAVDWELVIVDAESVALGAGIGEETSLQDRVGRWLDAWDLVGWREGGLLNFGKEVIGVLIEDELADFAEWILVFGPGLGEIKDGVLELFSLLRGHSLNMHGPGWELLVVDCLKEILSGVVWVGSCELGGFLVGEPLLALVGKEVDLDVGEISI